MKKLRVGVAGLGSFGELYTLILSQIPYVELHSVCSKTESRAKEIAEKYKVSSISTDYESFAKSKDLDVVCVVTLGKDHKTVVVPALESGKHVLVEKPIADNIADAQQMLDTSKNAQGIFMVAHICRFMPQYHNAKEMISKGKLGDIVMIQAHRNNHYSTLAPGKKINPLRETSIHDIDLALWFTGSQIDKSFGFKRYNQSSETPDSCMAVVKLKNNTMCYFASSWLGHNAMPAGVDANMKIIGTKGEIEIHQPSSNFVFIDDNEHSYFNPETTLNPLIIRETALATEIEYFLRCIIDGKKPDIITVEDAVKSLETSIMIDESCEDIKI